MCREGGLGNRVGREGKRKARCGEVRGKEVRGDRLNEECTSWEGDNG
jgi:hypothetical protein